VTDASSLRHAALDILNQALRRVDVRAALRGAVRFEGDRLTVEDATFDIARYQGIYVVALGKAALPMATTIDQLMGDRISGGVMSGYLPAFEKEGAGLLSRASFTSPGRWQVFAGGHPLPNEGSLAAARAALDLLDRANLESNLVIFLISGGGSAMLELPRDAATTLPELRALNRDLVLCGAGITEINAVRRAISRVKGGGLAAQASRAHQVSLIVSDVGTGNESTVASGPTFEPPTDAPDPLSVIERYRLKEHLPASIARSIEGYSRRTVRRPEVARHYLLLDNNAALEAAAEAARGLGFSVEIARDLVEQAIAEGCKALISRAVEQFSMRTSGNGIGCLVSGGEFACPVKGTGVGGRNLETALRCAVEIKDVMEKKPNSGPAHILALSAGTDGIDGNSPATGALADETTLTRGSSAGLKAADFLEASDSYNFFEPLGDTIVTGPTGTNVRDLRIVLAA
jgi:glycerate 2-kinase